MLKKFDCGCEWEVAVENDNIIAINYEPEKAPLDCPKTWQTIASGLTKGIFQLETPLGQSAAKVCKPTNIEELSVVTSCIRPGVGDSMLDDKTLKQHYIDRKNGLEEPVPPHPALSPVLESTLGILIYQEQAMEASKVIAGFDGVQADSLRKAAGKKLPELMAKIKTQFIEGAKAKGAATEEEAALIFSIIEASQRYSFNLSHAVSYSLDAIYFGAYAKAHFPRAFFLAELVYAKDIEEIGAVIDDSLNFNIEVCKPDLRLMNEEFTLTNRCIQYGLGRIKGCGEAKLKKLVEAIDNNNVSEMDWPQLMLCLSKTGSDAAYALIYAGALDFTLLTRTKMAFELSIFNRLNEKQQKYVVERKSLSNALTEMLEMGSGKTTLCYNKRSLAALEIVINEFNKPPKSMRDTPNQIFDWEMQYMGYAFTTSEVDESIANCTCHDFVEGKTLKEYTLVGTIARIKLILTKGKQPGQEMAFVEFKDSTNKVSGVMFPKQWLEYRQKLFEGNKLMFIGTRGSGNKNDSLIINRVMQL